jgi:hypothetical protein
MNSKISRLNIILADLWHNAPFLNGKDGNQSLPCWCGANSVALEAAHEDYCQTLRHAYQQIQWAIEDELDEPIHNISLAPESKLIH